MSKARREPDKLIAPMHQHLLWPWGSSHVQQHTRKTIPAATASPPSWARRATTKGRRTYDLCTTRRTGPATACPLLTVAIPPPSTPTAPPYLSPSPQLRPDAHATIPQYGQRPRRRNPIIPTGRRVSLRHGSPEAGPGSVAKYAVRTGSNLLPFPARRAKQKQSYKNHRECREAHRTTPTHAHLSLGSRPLASYPAASSFPAAATARARLQLDRRRGSCRHHARGPGGEEGEGEEGVAGGAGRPGPGGAAGRRVPAVRHPHRLPLPPALPAAAGGGPGHVRLQLGRPALAALLRRRVPPPARARRPGDGALALLLVVAPRARAGRRPPAARLLLRPVHPRQGHLLIDRPIIEPRLLPFVRAWRL